MTGTDPSIVERLGTLRGLLLRGLDPDSLPPVRRVALIALRVGAAVARDLSQGQLSLRAMSLVYTTLLSLVPLLAISFSVLKGFGVHNQMEPLIRELLAPLGAKGDDITTQIIGFVENVNIGVLGSVGLAFLVLTVLSLMQKIERAFNAAWHIRTHRPLAQRFSSYLTVVVIGPVLVFSAIGLTATLAGGAGELAGFSELAADVGRVMPFVLIVAAFTFLYLFLPNAKVRPGPALVGGLVAGLLWEAVGWGFASFVAGSSQYTAIYSAFAALILFLIWLYLGWLILLVGASIAFYVQNARYLHREPGAPRLGNRSRETVALSLVAAVARAYYGGGGPATLTGIAATLRLPPDALEPVVARLQTAGLVARTEDRAGTLVPGTPPETTPLKRVLDAVREDDRAPGAARPPAIAKDAAADAVMARIERAIEAGLEGATVKTIALGDEEKDATQAQASTLRAAGR